MSVVELINKVVVPQNRVKALLSLLVPALVIIIQPINLSGNQAVIIGVLFLVVIWLATDWVNRNIACILLIICFLIFGNIPIKDVLNFPLSENMLMIVAALLLSAGVVNSKITEKISDFFLTRFCRKGFHLIIFSFLLAALLVFIIPHPFPRVVLLYAIYVEFLDKYKVSAEDKQVFLFSVTVAVIVTSTLLLNGDVTAVYGAFSFARINMSYAEYAKYMFPPAFISTLLVFLSYNMVFRKEIKIRFPKDVSSKNPGLNKDGLKALIVMLAVIVFWALEPIHGISAAIVATAGAVLMFILRIISLGEIKNLNYSVLLFLTSMAAVGRTLIGSGTAEKIRYAILPILPSIDSFWFVPVIIIIIMSFHMVLGSVFASLSICIPIVIILTEGFWSSEFVAMLVLSLVTFHFILPIHNITLMIGFSSGYYKKYHVVKYGIWLTPLVFFSVLLLYVPWWHYLGI